MGEGALQALRAAEAAARLAADRLQARAGEHADAVKRFADAEHRLAAAQTAFEAISWNTRVAATEAIGDRLRELEQWLGARVAPLALPASDKPDASTDTGRDPLVRMRDCAAFAVRAGLSPGAPGSEGIARLSAWSHVQVEHARSVAALRAEATADGLDRHALKLARVAGDRVARLLRTMHATVLVQARQEAEAARWRAHRLVIASGLGALQSRLEETKAEAEAASEASAGASDQLPDLADAERLEELTATLVQWLERLTTARNAIESARAWFAETTGSLAEREPVLLGYQRRQIEVARSVRLVEIQRAVNEADALYTDLQDINDTLRSRRGGVADGTAAAGEVEIAANGTEWRTDLVQMRADIETATRALAAGAGKRREAALAAGLLEDIEAIRAEILDAYERLSDVVVDVKWSTRRLETEEQVARTISAWVSKDPPWFDGRGLDKAMAPFQRAAERFAAADTARTRHARALVDRLAATRADLALRDPDYRRRLERAFAEVWGTKDAENGPLRVPGPLRVVERPIAPDPAPPLDRKRTDGFTLSFTLVPQGPWTGSLFDAGEGALTLAVAEGRLEFSWGPTGSEGRLSAPLPGGSDPAAFAFVCHPSGMIVLWRDGLPSGHAPAHGLAGSGVPDAPAAAASALLRPAAGWNARAGAPFLLDAVVWDHALTAEEVLRLTIAPPHPANVQVLRALSPTQYGYSGVPDRAAVVVTSLGSRLVEGELKGLLPGERLREIRVGRDAAVEAFPEPELRGDPTLVTEDLYSDDALPYTSLRVVAAAGLEPCWVVEISSRGASRYLAVDPARALGALDAVETPDTLALFTVAAVTGGAPLEPILGAIPRRVSLRSAFTRDPLRLAIAGPRCLADAAEDWLVTEERRQASPAEASPAARPGCVAEGRMRLVSARPFSGAAGLTVTAWLCPPLQGFGGSQALTLLDGAGGPVVEVSASPGLWTLRLGGDARSVERAGAVWTHVEMVVWPQAEKVELRIDGEVAILPARREILSGLLTLAVGSGGWTVGAVTAWPSPAGSPALTQRGGDPLGDPNPAPLLAWEPAGRPVEVDRSGSGREGIWTEKRDAASLRSLAEEGIPERGLLPGERSAVAWILEEGARPRFKLSQVDAGGEVRWLGWEPTAPGGGLRSVAFFEEAATLRLSLRVVPPGAGLPDEPWATAFGERGVPVHVPGLSPMTPHQAAHQGEWLRVLGEAARGRQDARWARHQRVATAVRLARGTLEAVEIYADLDPFDLEECGRALALLDTRLAADPQALAGGLSRSRIRLEGGAEIYAEAAVREVEAGAGWSLGLWLRVQPGEGEGVILELVDAAGAVQQVRRAEVRSAGLADGEWHYLVCAFAGAASAGSPSAPTRLVIGHDPALGGGTVATGCEIEQVVVRRGGAPTEERLREGIDPSGEDVLLFLCAASGRLGPLGRWLLPTRPAWFSRGTPWGDLRLDEPILEPSEAERGLVHSASRHRAAVTDLRRAAVAEAGAALQFAPEPQVPLADLAAEIQVDERLLLSMLDVVEDGPMVDLLRAGTFADQLEGPLLRASPPPEAPPSGWLVPLSAAAAYTLEAWMKAPAALTDAPALWLGTVPRGGGEPRRWVSIRPNGDRWGFGTGETTLASPPHGGGWTHLAVVHPEGADEVDLFVGGRKVGTLPVSGGDGKDPVRLHVGAPGAPAGREYRGALAELRLWRGARTAAEISDAVNVTYPSSPPHLAVHVPFWLAPDGEPSRLAWALDDLPPLRRPTSLSFGGRTSVATFVRPLDVFNGPLTISLWLRVPEMNARQRCVLFGDYGRGAGGGSLELAGGRIRFFWNNKCRPLGKIRVDDGAWHHVVVVRDVSDAGAHRLRAYVDGVLDFDRLGVTSGRTSKVGPRCGLDYRPASGALPLLGLLSELRVWRRALDADAVRAAAHGPPSAEALVAHLPFDEGAGDVAHNRVDPSNPMGLVDCAWSPDGSPPRGVSTEPPPRVSRRKVTALRRESSAAGVLRPFRIAR